jgi:hypothetical protein
MPTAPNLSNTSNGGLIGYLSISLMLFGVFILLSSIPHFRESLTKHFSGLGNFIAPTKIEVKVEDTESTSKEPALRKEIESFDLSIFDK